MISRGFLERLRSGLAIHSRQLPNWRDGAPATYFAFSVKWTAEDSDARHNWRVSFSCRHKRIIVEKPRPQLTLVTSIAS